ncbi:MAG TPA: CpsD/CapB family tyrosine-protein kinase [Burkholderiales bacterium]
MSHERDASFHLGGGVFSLAWASSIGAGALFVVAWLLPSQYTATALTLALAVAVGLATAVACVAWTTRRPREANERTLVQALGSPLLAVRPLREAAVRGLCRQLLDHWLRHGRTLLPVVSAQRGEGRTYSAAQLAAGFATLGEKTLLIDADFRSPGLHAAFGVPNRDGLAEYLVGATTNPVPLNENLALLVAGQAGRSPLEMLGSERLKLLLAAASRHFRVIVVDTPAAAQGPDLEIFTALAGGALVVAGRADPRPLARLKAALARSSAQALAIVVNQRQSAA